MKNFKEFKERDQAIIVSKVAGYTEFLLKKKNPKWALKKHHVLRVTDWLWNDNIAIDPKTNMIPYSQVDNMLKACFNQ